MFKNFYIQIFLFEHIERHKTTSTDKTLQHQECCSNNKESDDARKLTSVNHIKEKSRIEDTLKLNKINKKSTEKFLNGVENAYCRKRLALIRSDDLELESKVPFKKRLSARKIVDDFKHNDHKIIKDTNQNGNLTTPGIFIENLNAAKILSRQNPNKNQEKIMEISENLLELQINTLNAEKFPCNTKTQPKIPFENHLVEKNEQDATIIDEFLAPNVDYNSEIKISRLHIKIGQELIIEKQNTGQNQTERLEEINNNIKIFLYAIIRKLPAENSLSVILNNNETIKENCNCSDLKLNETIKKKIKFNNNKKKFIKIQLLPPKL